MFSDLLNEMRREKIIAILRDVPIENFETVLDILKEEKIKILEIALNSKDIEKQFKILNEKYTGDFIVGAGTVITSERFEFALKNKVQFLLTPNVNEEILKKAEKNKILCVCGFFTISEALIARKYQCCKILKLFPAGELPLSYLKALRGPIDDLECMAVGGINKNNAADFLKAGFSCLGVGSSLVDNKLIKAGKFDELRENIRAIRKAAE